MARPCRLPWDPEQPLLPLSLFSAAPRRGRLRGVNEPDEGWERMILFRSKVGGCEPIVDNSDGIHGALATRWVQRVLCHLSATLRTAFPEVGACRGSCPVFQVRKQAQRREAACPRSQLGSRGVRTQIQGCWALKSTLQTWVQPSGTAALSPTGASSLLRDLPGRAWAACPPCTPPSSRQGPTYLLSFLFPYPPPFLIFCSFESHTLSFSPKNVSSGQSVKCRDVRELWAQIPAPTQEPWDPG